MDWQAAVPQETGWGQVDWSDAREVRLRPGQSALVLMGKGIWRGSHILSPEEIQQAAQSLSGYALAARQAEARQGFLPLAGGHRLGLCGEMGPGGVKSISSLCVRLAHEKPGVGNALFPLVKGASCLLAGPPGSGKTTLLRDLIRLYGLAGYQIGVADERGEIAACRDGKPQLQIGPGADVVTGMEKAKALPLLIRSMAPQAVATDELGGAADAAAVLDAQRCGVIVLATVHGKSLQDIQRREGMEKLFAARAFERLVLLKAPGSAPEVQSLSKEE